MRRGITRTFSKNRDRLIEHDAMPGAVRGRCWRRPGPKGLLFDEHFSVDGTLVRAWASQKSFVPKDGPPPPSSVRSSNPEVDFRGQQRTNDTHARTSRPRKRGSIARVDTSRRRCRITWAMR